ncbi:MAG: homocysteine S-methyltransferase family protein [Thermomicrobiales bacterium]|nr:homocysteine S-methyltransferase family protein [Thermomicrobiales bacterium]
MSTVSSVLPYLAGYQTVTDGGLETELIFIHGIDLPEMAAFPLLETEAGRDRITRYYDDYATIAAAAGAALLLETPTWCANPDRAAPLGYDAAGLRQANLDSVAFMQDLRRKYLADVPVIAVSGMVGPRGDGYVSAGAVDPEEARAYHLPQITTFAEAGADCTNALTIPEVGEAIGIILAAREVGLPVGVSLTVETNGVLPDGTPLGAAMTRIQEVAAPDWFMVNCAHPNHVEAALGDGGEWVNLLRGLRCNASKLSHAELDESEVLDAGDPREFGEDHARMRTLFPELTLIGGCCGTDARHVAAIWGVAEQLHMV